jgi:predicted dienelactone hydrolase
MRDIVSHEVREYQPPQEDHSVAARHRELEERDVREAEFHERMAKLAYILDALERIKQRLDLIHNQACRR